MAPVKAGYCRYESLKDGSLDLGDIALMHDDMAMRFDNEQIARRLAEKK